MTTHLPERAIELRNLTLGYDRHPAVHHLDATIREASLTAVVGPNGAGKTTLLRGIAGILKPLDGAVHLSGSVRRGVAYLPQRVDIDREFPATVFELVAMGLWSRIGPFGPVTRAMQGQIESALAAVGLEGLAERTVGSLSGGQLRRVMFARLFVQDAQVLLLDEPFVEVDEAAVADLMAVIQRWYQEGRVVMAVLHDLDEVRGGFPDALLLARELIAHGPTEEVLTEENIERARRCWEAFNDRALACERGRLAA